MEIGGIYPMLYAFFDEEGALNRQAIERQVQAALTSEASGIAVLGLGSEVQKLSRKERQDFVTWTAEAVDQKCPILVTIAENNAADMIESAKDALDRGASWIMLQPPRPPASGAHLSAIFAQVAKALDCPIGIQNAPEFLGIGLTNKELADLNANCPNVCVAKAEANAVSVAETITALPDHFKVFNGRAGLELTDNYRAGVAGMIPGIETVDLQQEIAAAMSHDHEDLAEDLYRNPLPCVAFIMQNLPHFIAYGKLIAALRLGLKPSAPREPFQPISKFGRSLAMRYAEQLGPLPTT